MLSGFLTPRDCSTLNDDVSLQEVREVVQRLRPNIAPGDDGIKNEFLKNGGEPLVVALWNLITSCWNQISMPEEWRRAIVVPIPKAGQDLDIEACRPITLLSCVFKVLTMVMQARLVRWCQLYDVILPEQGGFMPGRNTCHQIFSLLELVQAAKPAPVFACFFDLAKAYDSVWRRGLWRCLRAEGISGRFLQMVQFIYSSTPSRLVLATQDWSFDLDCGVRQGCVLSPLLFNLFINNLIRIMRHSNIGIHSPALPYPLSMLLYADDIVLLADSPECLQQLIDLFRRYCLDWALTVNARKSKAMIFNKPSSFARHHVFHYGHESLETVNEFCYLGVYLTADLKWNRMASHISSRSSWALSKLLGIGSVLRYLSPAALVQMFKALVRSRLEYAAEVWAPTSFLWPQADKIQLKWVRAVWNLPPNSSTMAPLCELTLWPLILRRHYLRLSFLWSLSHSAASSIHYQLFVHRVKSLALGAKAAASDWLLSTHHLLSTLELEHVLDNNASALMELHSDAWKSMCKKGLLANLTEQWHDYLDKHSYLSTYRELSPDFLTRLPAYLHTALAANVVAPYEFALGCI